MLSKINDEMMLTANKCIKMSKTLYQKKEKKNHHWFFTPNERNKRGKIMRDHDDDAFNLSGMCSNRPSLKSNTQHDSMSNMWLSFIPLLSLWGFRSMRKQIFSPFLIKMQQAVSTYLLLHILLFTSSNSTKWE